LAITPFSLSKFRIAFAAWWLIWLLLQAIMIYWLGFPILTAFLDSVVSNTLLTGCCLLVTINLKYYQPKFQRYWFIIVLSIVLSGLWLLLSRWLLMLLFTDTAYQQFLSKTIPVRFGIGFLLTGCMAMISLVWYSLQEQKEIESRKRETEKLAKEAELFKLRNQLQPHFLFNSLNSINALIGINPEQARNMIQQLSDFLRGSIRREEQVSVSVAEELQYLGLYLSIEKQRFGHRLSADVQTDEACLNMKLPNMLLQPIVENAIKFGLYDTTGDISIKIIAKAVNGYLVITVENPFDSQTATVKHGTGFGLTSVQRRLQLLYSRSDLLETNINEEVFTATVRIPQQLV
jgi:two-component system, LytTR family, sensor kinase